MIFTIDNVWVAHLLLLSMLLSENVYENPVTPAVDDEASG